MEAPGFVGRLGPRLRASWLQQLIILAGLLFEAGFTASVPLAFQTLIDRVIAPHDTSLLFPILGFLAAGAMSVALVGVLRDYIFAKVSAALLQDLRHQMFGHLQRLPPGDRRLADMGEIAARFSTDIASVEHALVAAIPWAGLPMLDAIFSTMLLFWIEWRLALVAVLVFPLALVGPKIFAGRASAASYERKQRESVVLGALHETLGAQTAVKAFGLEETVVERFAQRLSSLAASSTKTAFFGSLVERSAGIGILMLHVIVLGVGATLALSGRLSLGALVSFQSLFLTLSWSLSYVAQYAPTLVVASGAMRRIEELFALLPQVSDAPGAAVLRRLSSDITFEQVTFGHVARTPTLVDVSFRILAGERIAIVGPVGSGKSTVTKILARFRDPDAGRVLIDGHDLRHVTLASLRGQIAMVFQESFLFEASIRENIRLGRLDATDSEVEAAASLVGLHELIEELPHGYDTQLGPRGEGLSGGQRQLIAIARAMLRDPTILILDEATSALDTRASTLAQMTFDLAARGRTILAVTHRLAAARSADRILVMNEGRLVEQGTHDELLANGSLYPRLWARRDGAESESVPAPGRGVIDA